MSRPVLAPKPAMPATIDLEPCGIPARFSNAPKKMVAEKGFEPDALMYGHCIGATRVSGVLVGVTLFLYGAECYTTFVDQIVWGVKAPDADKRVSRTSAGARRAYVAEEDGTFDIPVKSTRA